MHTKKVLSINRSFDLLTLRHLGTVIPLIRSPVRSIIFMQDCDTLYTLDGWKKKVGRSCQAYARRKIDKDVVKLASQVGGFLEAIHIDLNRTSLNKGVMFVSCIHYISNVAYHFRGRQTIHGTTF